MSDLTRMNDLLEQLIDEVRALHLTTLQVHGARDTPERPTVVQFAAKAVEQARAERQQDSQSAA